LLRPDVSYYDIFRSLFPSGSVTGAPKIRTMQIIRDLERDPRGIYTGAIGMINPDGSCTFNVAIRTLLMKDGHVRMGVGGGIVADSDPQGEFDECRLKAAFLTRTQPDFQLIETILWDQGYQFLTQHLQRLEASAEYFGFPLDLTTTLANLYSLSESLEANGACRVRLLLRSDGTLSTETARHLAGARNLRVKLAPVASCSTDVFRRHKTTMRAIYDTEYSKAREEGFDEVLFTNEKGEVTEGAISNVFVEKGGGLLTPPVSCGVLPGVFRRHLLESGPAAEERVLTVEDLKSADTVFLCNSIRGIQHVEVLCLPHTTPLRWNIRI